MSLKVKYSPDQRLFNSTFKKGHWCASLTARGRQIQAFWQFCF